jgi:pyruvate,water dikinase
VDPTTDARAPAADDRAGAPLVVDLADPVAADPALTGGKAAALARAAAAGFPTLPGFVLTTAFCDAVDGGADVAGHRATWDAFSAVGGHRRPLIARSSSVVEDAAGSSLAGQFASVAGFSGYDEFVEAVRTVHDSRDRAGAADQPIAVLVQPLLEAEVGGVLFGVDPVSGRSDRRVVTAVEGSPEALVGGEEEGSRYVLDPDGKVVESTGDGGPALGSGFLRELARLAAAAADTFGGPQDIEWARDADGVLWLLQSRPVTTEVRGTPSGPVFGPGPVAETFPEPLTELECDLWLPPLREALREAVILAGAVSRSEAEATDAVVAVGGHVAVDMRLAGEIRTPISVWQRLNPVPAARRLRVAWRVGRLRAALPVLADTLVERVDADLESVPPLDRLTSRQLVGLLRRGQVALRSLHAHEILMGLLTNTGHNRTTGASVALRVLAQAREDGLGDEEVLRRSPIVLALVPPRVAPHPELPPEATALNIRGDADGGNDNGVRREALRLRIRWLHELTGRAAWELGERLVRAYGLAEPGLVRHLGLDHVEAVVTKRAILAPAQVAAHEHDDGEPLPAWFQLSDLGRPIPTRYGDETGGGTGAGGGVGRGPVTDDAVDPPIGSVLVTTTLTPGLGPLLPRLAGIVAESGSVLSHLAILARESGVATVVGYAGASNDLPVGAEVEVDGQSGRVTVCRDGERGADAGGAG